MSTNNNSSEVVITYHPNGQIHRVDYFKGGELHGVCRAYFKDGTRSSIMEYERGVQRGVYNLFFTDGTEYVIGSCLEGKFHGEYKMFYVDGNLQYHEHYLHGLEHGESKCYHKNGVLRYNGFFQQDNAFGELIECDPRGHITKHVFCDGSGGDEEYPVSEYIQDPRNITPEEEVTLALLYSGCILSIDTRRSIYSEDS